MRTTYHRSRTRRVAAFATLFAALALLAAPGIAYAITLASGGGFDFDIAEVGQGTIGDGQTDAYNTAYLLTVNSAVYTTGTLAATPSMGGRQYEMAEMGIGSLRVKRLIYVPTTGGDYARYVDVVSNPGTTARAATIRISGTLGSGTTTVVSGSSSGDAVVSPADAWFGTDDANDGSGDTSTAHVVQYYGGGTESPTSMSLTDAAFVWQYDVSVPAGGRVAILTYAVQGMNRAATIAEATRILELPDDVLVGIEPYLADIVNFPLTGAPVVRFDAPTTANEGDAITLGATVTDREGDTATWTWDLDGDGTFGDLPNATTHTIPAGTTDGPGEVRIGIQTTDGASTRVATHTIAITNVAPVFAPDPPTMAAVRREYVHQLAATDPAGPLDPPEFRLTARPGGLLMDLAGRITWTPPIEFRGEDYVVTALVEDGDGGEDELTWTITVAENELPPAPMPVSPIDRVRVAAGEPVTLTVANAVDADGDPLAYTFQLSPTSSFSGGSVTGSGEVSEGEDGMTSWTTPGPLNEGFWYWRVWANDGIGDGPSFNAAFAVGAGGVIPGETDGGRIMLPDAGVEAPRSSGCSVDGAPGAARGGWAGLALLALALVWRRGRRAMETK